MTSPATGIERKLDTVLIADDEASIRLLIQATIGNGEYDIVEAVEGEEAWGLIQEHRPALVLLDVNISGWSGLEILKATKADSRLAGTRVILLTTSVDEPATVAAMAAGADAFLIEPFSPRDLLARLDEALWLNRLIRR